MDVSDVLVFLGVIIVLVSAIGIGAALALGVISPLSLIIAFIGLLVLGLFGAAIYYLKGYLIQYLARRKKETPPAAKPVSKAEPESKPAPDYQSIMEKELAKRCEDFSSKFLLCRIAVDNIKKIEEQHGRDVLELFLTEAEKRMLKLLKQTDKLYRADNDEYVALLETETTDEWKKRLAEIDRGMRSMFVFNFQDTEICIDTSVSVGFAIFPMMSQSPEELLKIADTQLSLSRDEVQDEVLPDAVEEDNKESESLENLVSDTEEKAAEEGNPEEPLNLEELLSDNEKAEPKAEEPAAAEDIQAAEPVTEEAPKESETLDLEELLADATESKTEEKSEA